MIQLKQCQPDLQQTRPTGASSSATYAQPAPFQPATSTDEQQNQRTYVYDSRGNATSSTGGGVTTSATFNPPAGTAPACGGKPGQQCTSTDGNNQTTRYAYDAGGNLLSATPPAGTAALPAAIKATSYTYDGAGRVRTVRDGTGRTSTSVYDKLDRLLETRYDGATTCTATDIAGDRCIQYAYNLDGALTSRQDTAGTTTYGYNLAGRQTSQGLAAANTGAATPVALTYDPSGNLLSVGDAYGTTRYAYDDGNNLLRLTEPGGSCTDAGGLPYNTTTRLAPDNSGCVTYAYDNKDKRTVARFPGDMRQTTAYDASGRVTAVTGGRPGVAPVMQFQYDYRRNNGAGLVDSALVQTRFDLLPATDVAQSYTYDGLNRLTRATERPVGGAASALWAYCYDGAGNRTYDSTSLSAPTLCPGQAGGPAPTATYDATNALRARGAQPAPNSAYTYDGNGNETAATGTNVRTGGTYNAKNQLTALTTGPAGASAPNTFTYAGSSQNERTTADGARYRNTPLGLTAQTDPTTIIIREPNGAPVALRAGGTNTSSYYLTDNQGSVISVVNAVGTETNRYAYDPYGNPRSATGPAGNPLRYTGGYLDPATGLYKLGIRYYDPALGRFTQADPTGQDPHYTYSGNNPVNFTDLSGAACDGYVNSSTGSYDPDSCYEDSYSEDDGSGFDISDDTAETLGTFTVAGLAGGACYLGAGAAGLATGGAGFTAAFVCSGATGLATS